MNIWISSNALQKGQEALLWPGALFGLPYLKQLGHQVVFEDSELGPKQRRLLQNEGIASEAIEKDQCELTIAGKERLEAKDTEGTVIETAGNWMELSNRICFPTRKASIDRTTSETVISLSLNLDGEGHHNINTGLHFFDHMLEQIARHGLIDLELQCEGDLEVDEHHTIEDVAIALGQALNKALGSKIGIQRYSFVLPMDESRATVALDLSGRAYLQFSGGFDREYVGDLPTEMVEHFFYSLAINLKSTLHVEVHGGNDHHKIESCFKGLARCLRASVSRSERNLNILPSTKDLL